jgi:hypothetical protein
MVRIDRVTGLLATEFTPAEMIEERPFKIYPEPYRQWAEQHNIPQPPREQSDLFTSEPNAAIREPVEGAVLQGTVTVMGSANVPGFANYEIQYGVSHDPGAFSAAIWGPVGDPVEENILGYWDTSTLFPGPHTLRLVVRDQFGNEYERRVRVFVEAVAAAEPTLTPTWTPIPVEEIPTETPIPAETPIPLETVVPPETEQPPPAETPIPELPVEPEAPPPTDTPTP